MNNYNFTGHSTMVYEENLLRSYLKITCNKPSNISAITTIVSRPNVDKNSHFGLVGGCITFSAQNVLPRLYSR